MNRESGSKAAEQFESEQNEQKNQKDDTENKGKTQETVKANNSQ